jgi:hypothetical protein
MKLGENATMGTTIEIRRITSGPPLVIEDAEGLALDFFRTDASSKPGGYDDQAGHGARDLVGARDRITDSDIVAINTTMRARSPHSVWATLTSGLEPLGWLSALDPAWDLVELDEETWQARARPAVENALVAATGPGRGISVGTKVLHLKRPRMFPVLDRLVLDQLGVTESVGPMRTVEHLRTEGQRNIDELRAIRSSLSRHYDRSLVRILDVLLWVSHPAAGLAPSLRGWQHVMRRKP